MKAPICCKLWMDLITVYQSEVHDGFGNIDEIITYYVFQCDKCGKVKEVNE